MTHGLRRGRVPLYVDKTSAIAALIGEAGLQGIDPGDHQIAEDTLWRLSVALGGDANPELLLAAAADLPDAREELLFPARVHEIGQPICTNGLPVGMPEQVGQEHSPALSLLSLPGGFFAHVGRAPVTLMADGVTVVRDYSSRFAGLVCFYDVDVAEILAAATIVAGTALVLSDDISSLNYCHWLVDTLPRLACVGARRDVTVVVSDARAAFKRDTLRLCGFADEQILYLPDFSAVRADTLLVPNATREIAHPAHRAASWAIDFLRARIGMPSLLAAPSAARPGKLYVSRGDWAGRRVLNEPALLHSLVPAGYHPVTLSAVPLAEQVCLFSQATHIVGLHGAGLANIAFAPAGARLIEIFPQTYGMPSYYVLAAGQGMSYASYIAAEVQPGDRAQLDDVVVDLADFERCCGALL